MLEGLVANLLNRFLGIYVRNFDPKQLNVGIWSGDVQLRNLEMRREALDQLKLPINVIEGHIGLLTLSIPWSNLRGKPVRVTIEDVFLLAAPKEDQQYDTGEEERRAQAIKMEKLDSAELLKERNTEGMTKEEQEKNQSFSASLTTAIVDNLQISVKNVHVRYEDSISDPGHPFAVGLTLQELIAVSTDEDWKPTFIQSSSGTTHKLATLGAFAMYWDTDVQLLCSGKSEETAEDKALEHSTVLQKLKDMIAQKNGKDLTDHQYILKPVTGRAGLEMDKTGRVDRPKVKARLLFNELGFIFDDDQYRDALRLIDQFHYFTRHQEYKKTQPRTSPTEDPRAWLVFAINAVRERIHDKNKVWSWAYMKERRDDRIRYVELFKKKKREEKLDTDQSADLERLEKKLSYEDLRFWRSLARNQLRKENVGSSKKPAGKQTWSQWVWGSGKAEDQHDDGAQMSDEQRKELYTAIDYDEKKQLAEAVEMPREAISLQVDMSLKEGSFTLKRDPHGRGNEMLKLVFEGLDTRFLQRTDSTLLDLSLEAMNLMDGTTKGNLYEHALRVKASHLPVKDGRKSRLNSAVDKKEKLKLDDHVKALGMDGASEEVAYDALFAMTFENKPLNNKADTALAVQLRAMEFIYNPKLIEEVVKFFAPPERHMESIGALMESAEATVEGLRQQTRAGLEYALTEHKTIDVQLDMQAPLIIIPNTVTEASTMCMILDAGHIAVRSNLIDKATLEQIQSKQKHQYTDDDYKKLEGLVYDKFNVSLKSTQLLLGSSIDETRKHLHSPDAQKSFHVLDQINIDLLVETCIVPRATDLTKLRITGHLPILHVSISDVRYKKLMTLLSFAIPNTSSEATTQQTSAAKPNEQRPPMGGRSKSIIGSGRTKSRTASFQYSAQRQAILEDNDSDKDDDKTLRFQDASEGDDQKEHVNIEQKGFQLNFTVDELRGSLYRADPTGKKDEKLLIDLVAQKFALDYFMRPFDMVAELKLGRLLIEDHIEENVAPEFKNLVSSDDTSTNNKEDLFTVKYIGVANEHPHFMSEYEGFGTNVDVAVSTLNLLVTRKSLLVLLDFVYDTFTTPASPVQIPQIDSSPEKTVHLDLPNEAPLEPVVVAEPWKMRIKTQLKRIALILNNDGIRLATLALSSAEVAVLMTESTMRVAARLGNLTLVDDINQGVSVDSYLRQLISIQGEEFADFVYETFDPKAYTYPGYDYAVKLHSGSLKVNFVTEPFRKIMEFGVKFGQMQGLFNAARQAAANQAQSMQQQAYKMHMDINIKTPIVAFPRLSITGSAQHDVLTAYLGEIYAKNAFMPIDDSEDAIIANKLNAGIHNIRLTCKLNYKDDESEELELIDKVDIDFQVSSADHRKGQKRPDTEVSGSMSDLNLRLTQAQLRFILELSRTIPEAFATTVEDVSASVPPEQQPKPIIELNKPNNIEPKPAENSSETPITHLGPELGEVKNSWTSLDIVFKAGAIGLEMITGRIDKPVKDLAAASLSKFSLNGTSVKLRMLNDGSMESELLIQAFNIMDTRTKDKNKFRKIMSLINTDVKQQFMASVSISAGVQRNLVALVTIDSPQVIVALDHLFALQTFISESMVEEDPVVIELPSSDDADDNAADDASDVQSSVDMDDSAIKVAEPVQTSKGMTMSYRVNIVDAQVVLIANPAITSSEAVVLGVKQALLSQQHAMTMQVSKVGMFLCRMDKYETTQLRILDDFGIQLSLDTGSSIKDSSLTSIEVSIDPLVLRLSLRDILLAMQIFQKATSTGPAADEEQTVDQEPAKLQQIKASAASKDVAQSVSRKQVARTASTPAIPKPEESTPLSSSTIVKREEMTVTFQGVRVVLIGDRHELPILDWSVHKFAIDIRDWSGAMTADSSIDMFFNVFNFSKSAWEPLIEPWQLGLHVARSVQPERLAIETFSRKSMEITLTSASIALFMKSAQFFSTDEDVLSKPRGLDAPFRMRNQTGFDLHIWTHSRSEDDGEAAKMADGEEIPWRFADATTTRETLSAEGSIGLIGVKLEGSGFDSIDRIPISREGETLYNLRPRPDKIQHRLLVEVRLGQDNVKYITFRSPLLVENNTQVPIEIGVFDQSQGHLSKIDKIAPGDSRPAPVGAAYVHSIVIRPDPGFGYSWCDERIFWKDLLKQPVRAITCRSESAKNAVPFHFQMQSVFDKKDPLTAVYPYQRIRLSAPIEIQNLLPYDFKYRVYDKTTKKDWTNFLRKGGVSPVHVVDLSHLLLMSITLQDTPFKPSEFAIINASDKEEFTREKTMVVKDEDDLPLRLKLHY